MREPIFFERNRVGRVYTGGKLFAGFFGDEPEDGFLPEEWIASCVKAVNRVIKTPKDGVSRLEGSGRYFDEVLAEHPMEMLGSSQKMRILVKVLDSAVRLPAQAHPDKAYSRKYFHSDYGKTESWIILDTRPDAKLFFGFRDGVDRETFSKAIDESMTDKDAMERLLRYRYPQKKEAFLVPAKAVHAIGAGCLILEIQEPTDFTIQPEHWCGDYKLNDMEMYQGVSREAALECFDYTQTPDTKMEPEIISESEDVIYENLIGPADTDCFVINRIRLTGGKHVMKLPDSYGVYIVTEGEGRINGEDYQRAVKKGDYFFLPCCAMGAFTLNGNLECVECY